MSTCQPKQKSETCGLDEKDHAGTPRTWADMQIHFSCLRLHRAWCFLNAAARKWKDIRGHMRSEIHPRPQTSMTKGMQHQTNDSTDHTEGFCVCLSYCRSALSSCSTNHHWCLPKNRSHQRTRLETRCASLPWYWMSNGCLRKRLPNTHPVWKLNAKQHVCKTERQDWTEDTVKVQKMLIHRHRLEDTHTCVAHPNRNSNTQRADLETYVDNVGQRDRRNDMCVSGKALLSPQWETGKLVNTAKTPKSNTHYTVCHDAPKNVWPKIESYHQDYRSGQQHLVNWVVAILKKVRVCSSTL